MSGRRAWLMWYIDAPVRGLRRLSTPASHPKLRLVSAEHRAYLLDRERKSRPPIAGLLVVFATWGTVFACFRVNIAFLMWAENNEEAVIARLFDRLWLGVAMLVLYGWILVAGAVAGALTTRAIAWRRLSSEQAMLPCWECGFDLRGHMVSGAGWVCPECGHENEKLRQVVESAEGSGRS